MGVVKRGPPIMITKPAAKEMKIQFPIVFSRLVLSFAPKNCATRIPAPVAIPTNSASSRLRIGSALPTDASAV